MKKNIVATFSIVGVDPETGEHGIAVQSKFIAVGSVVPWAKAGVGAVATQAFANPSYGPRGLELLEKGYTPEEVVDLLTKDDPQREERQVGIVDAKGNSASYTGEQCYDWAGGIHGKNFAAQGNILVNEATVSQMAKTFEQSQGTLAERLLSCLQAAQEAGGDSRGKQSAALYIVKDKGGYGGFNDRLVDLLVDDHPEPIQEITRLYQLQQLYFGETKQENVLLIEGTTKQKVISGLVNKGYLRSMDVSEEELQKRLTEYLHTENFEERELEPGKIDKEVLDFLNK
ncbi:DUF1028 domain-containing protein [Sediminibacillus halophilus]|uniref:Uncharacterized conserved protein, Ntn-hydrolase superfamily n=1 Tax=Sediminibacillus halophilus TaxID=482461 RepID=A0A1G9N371_9BACI|nr:DUF1028 domain-containing protein [Sediminibacillus halophilus]SDL80315.1 Uncharacterized conserved protein, Ntn-hydrolase superfamily [Sediminibacillus halophilus]